ncbi:hypothetical protein AWB69_06619 [Caballeronia udeis]|uniref:Uncharacterized protein n=1 Tax=Caballeronia udeis TaxID=1232866 RepID=A0A158IUU5_9BURK|nr:hypothetical protein AWB69_06619 [Caballeronia udeis]
MARARRVPKASPDGSEALPGKDLRDDTAVAEVAARPSSGTVVTGGNQRFFGELLVHARHSPRVNRTNHLT